VFCDLNTVDPTDYVLKKMIYRERDGEIYNVRHNTNQKWYYFPHMSGQEAALFLTQYPDGRTTCHSGALDAETDVPDAGPSRRSMEVRLFVKVKDALPSRS